MNAKHMMEKAQEMMERAKQIEKQEREKIQVAFGKLLQRHVDEDFKNCTIDYLKMECIEIMNSDKKKSMSSNRKPKTVSGVEA